MSARAETLPTPEDVRRERRLRWIVPLGAWLVRLLGSTWRIRRVHGERFDASITGPDPIVYSLWHGRMLPLLYQHRNQGIVVLISEHGDGELIARVAERLGFATIRGSTSRGASRALIAMTRELEKGAKLAITPDGPRGPARSFAPGALAAAHRSGAPIMVLGVTASRAWRLRSWDGFLIPKPFSRVMLAYGAPEKVEGASTREATEDTSRFQDLMDEIEREANA